MNLLLWGIGLISYCLAAVAAGLFAIFGWQQAWGEINFKIWYLLGAVLVPAWLGQGTVFLLWRTIPQTMFLQVMLRVFAPKSHPEGFVDHSIEVTKSDNRSRTQQLSFAVPTFVVLLIGSAFATYWVFAATVDPTPLLDDSSELTGNGVLPSNVRRITPFFNVYGMVTLVGGALWSAYNHWRRPTHANHLIGNMMIATGMILAAAGGVLSRLGLPGINIGLLIGSIFAFWGFIKIASDQSTKSSSD